MTCDKNFEEACEIRTDMKCDKNFEQVYQTCNKKFEQAYKISTDVACDKSFEQACKIPTDVTKSFNKHIRFITPYNVGSVLWRLFSTLEVVQYIGG